LLFTSFDNAVPEMFGSRLISALIKQAEQESLLAAGNAWPDAPLGGLAGLKTRERFR